MSENQSPVEILEVVHASALAERAVIDSQIATAKQYPRSMQKFKMRAIDMATLDLETAESCIYSRPVGKDENGKMKFAEGLSVRMAEIVGAAYGNLRVGSTIIEMSERRVVARGQAHDLESNFAAQTDVVEPTVKKNGQPYDERMRAVIAKAALAKARRDATFQVVPKALCRPVESEVRKLIEGDGTTQTIAKRRSNVMVWISKLGIDKKRVFDALEIKGEDDIGTELLARLVGLRTAIRDGEVTVDETFPVTVPAATVSLPQELLKSKAAAKKPPPEEKKPDPPQEKPAPDFELDATPPPQDFIADLFKLGLDAGYGDDDVTSAVRFVGIATEADDPSDISDGQAQEALSRWATLVLPALKKIQKP